MVRPQTLINCFLHNLSKITVYFDNESNAQFKIPQTAYVDV